METLVVTGRHGEHWHLVRQGHSTGWDDIWDRRHSACVCFLLPSLASSSMPTMPLCYQLPAMWHGYVPCGIRRKMSLCMWWESRASNVWPSVSLCFPVLPALPLLLTSASPALPFCTAAFPLVAFNYYPTLSSWQQQPKSITAQKPLSVACVLYYYWRRTPVGRKEEERSHMVNTLIGKCVCVLYCVCMMTSVPTVACNCLVSEKIM